MRWGHERLVGCRALSPAIREARAPHRLENQDSKGSSPSGKETDRGGVLRHRLGRRPPRRRPGRRDRKRRRQAPHRRRRRRVHAVAAAAGRGRRQRRKPDPGGHRDQPWAAGRLPAGHRTQRVCDQPESRRPLPRPARGDREEVRRRRRARAGPHPAHRPGRAPPAARRLRTRPGHRGARPRPTGRGVGTHLRAQQAAFPAARVLPGAAGRVRAPSAAGSCAQKPARYWPPHPPLARRPS